MLKPVVWEYCGAKVNGRKVHIEEIEQNDGSRLYAVRLRQADGTVLVLNEQLKWFPESCATNHTDEFKRKYRLSSFEDAEKRLNTFLSDNRI